MKKAAQIDFLFCGFFAARNCTILRHLHCCAFFYRSSSEIFALESRRRKKKKKERSLMFSTQAIASNIYFHCNYCIQRILPHCIIQGFVTWCFSVFSYNRSLHEESWHNWQCSTTCPRGFRDCCVCATMQR